MILASASLLSLVLGGAASAAYALPAAAAARLGPRGARGALLVAWLFHALLLAWGLLGTDPRFGWAPALSVTAWLVVTVYAVESQFFPQLEPRLALATLGAIAVLLALLYPGNPLHATASPWWALHTALGIASYGLFAAAVVHAWLMRRAEKQIRLAADPQSGMPLLTLERLTFRFVMAGFVLLSATLLAGWLFSENLVGNGGASGWKWDHKTVFSILSWIVFAVLLIGRTRFGWRGRRARRVLYAGAVLLLLAYVGSRFVLEVVLGRAT